MTASTEPPTPFTGNPYVGPSTFVEAQAPLFFGREQEARDLTARVVSERLMLFYAQSGAGKSSLLNARLIPNLRGEEGFQVLPTGRVSGHLPERVKEVENIYVFNLIASLDQSSEDPLRLAGLTLSQFLASIALESVVNEQGGRTRRWAYRPQPIPASAPNQSSSTAQTPRFVLIIDQFEELITGHPERWTERADFFRQLNQALLDDPTLWVVLTLREDYVAALDPYADLLANRLRARFYMERMGSRAALEAVTQPAQLGGRPFAPGVAEQLVDNLRRVRLPGQPVPIPGQYVEPVQLQVVCFQLWEQIRQRPPGAITDADLQEAGNVDQTLGQFYEDALQAVLGDPTLNVSERQLRTWFSSQLITEEGTRGTVFQGEESTAGMDNRVVDILESRRLLRKEVRAGGDWIELVHDRFVEPIVLTNQQHQTPLARVATLWADRQQDPWLLYRDAQLQASLAELAAQPAQFSSTEREFLEASSRAENVRRRGQRQLFTGLALFVFILLASLSVWALRSRAEAIRLRGQAEQALADAEIQMVNRINAQSTAEAASTGNVMLAENLMALLTAQAASLESQPPAPIPPPEVGTPQPRPTASPTADLAITAVVKAVQTQLAQQVARDTASQAVSQQTDSTLLYAVIPDIDMRVFSGPDASTTVLAQVRQPDRLPVIAVSGEWANVQLDDGRTGWLRAIFTTYEGDASVLPESLRYLVTSNRADLPFVRGTVISFGGSVGDWLLTDPTDQQSGYVWVPVDTQVTLLLAGKGLTEYGSGIWYFVMLVDPRNPAQVVKGWLPSEVLVEAN